MHTTILTSREGIYGQFIWSLYKYALVTENHQTATLEATAFFCQPLLPHINMTHAVFCSEDLVLQLQQTFALWLVSRCYEALQPRAFVPVLTPDIPRRFSNAEVALIIIRVVVHFVLRSFHWIPWTDYGKLGLNLSLHKNFVAYKKNETFWQDSVLRDHDFSLIIFGVGLNFRVINHSCSELISEYERWAAGHYFASCQGRNVCVTRRPRVGPSGGGWMQ